MGTYSTMDEGRSDRLDFNAPFLGGLRFEKTERPQLPAMLRVKLEDRIAVGEELLAVVRLGGEKDVALALFTRGTPVDHDVPDLHAINRSPVEICLGRGLQIALGLPAGRSKLIRDVDKGRIEIVVID